MLRRPPALVPIRPSGPLSAHPDRVAARRASRWPEPGSSAARPATRGRRRAASTSAPRAEPIEVHADSLPGARDRPLRRTGRSRCGRRGPTIPTTTSAPPLQGSGVHARRPALGRRPAAARHGEHGATVALDEPSLWADGAARAAHERAVARAQRGDRRPRALRSRAPPRRSRRRLPRVGRRHRAAAGALTYRDLQRSAVVGGRIVYASTGAARTSASSRTSWATCSACSTRSARRTSCTIRRQTAAAAFSPHERLSIRLLLQRNAGNRYPDNDRTAAGASGPTTSVVVD